MQQMLDMQDSNSLGKKSNPNRFKPPSNISSAAQPDSVTVLVQEVDKIEREINAREAARQQQIDERDEEELNDFDEYRDIHSRKVEDKVRAR